jgi:hypothetical protein
MPSGIAASSVVSNIAKDLLQCQFQSSDASKRGISQESACDIIRQHKMHCLFIAFEDYKADKCPGRTSLD